MCVFFSQKKNHRIHGSTITTNPFLGFTNPPHLAGASNQRPSTVAGIAMVVLLGSGGEVFLWSSLFCVRVSIYACVYLSICLCIYILYYIKIDIFTHTNFKFSHWNVNWNKTLAIFCRSKSPSSFGNCPFIQKLHPTRENLLKWHTSRDLLRFIIVDGSEIRRENHLGCRKPWK